MPFVPTEKQVDGLCSLLKQFVRESTEVRVIRFMKFAEYGIGNNVVEVSCLEDIDRYFIFFDGRIEQRRMN